MTIRQSLSKVEPCTAVLRNFRRPAPDLVIYLSQTAVKPRYKQQLQSSRLNQCAGDEL